MSDFAIDPKLEQDCYILGDLENSRLLLMNNALWPWFILLPETQHHELHHLQPDRQQQLLSQISQLSSFIESRFDIDKLNTACIGNIVRQLHIHIIGRRETDPCWPGVVWGTTLSQPYDMNQLQRIVEWLEHCTELAFKPQPMKIKN